MFRIHCTRVRVYNSSAAWDAPEMDAVVQAELDFGALTVSRCQQFLVF